jgi:hypothetical protein
VILGKLLLKFADVRWPNLKAYSLIGSRVTRDLRRSLKKKKKKGHLVMELGQRVAALEREPQRIQVLLRVLQHLQWNRLIFFGDHPNLT